MDQPSPHWAPTEELFAAAKGLAARASGFHQQYRESGDNLYRRRERALALASLLLTQAALETWIHGVLEQHHVEAQGGWVGGWVCALQAIPPRHGAEAVSLPKETKKFFRKLSAIRKRTIHDDARARKDFGDHWGKDVDPRAVLTADCASQAHRLADEAFHFAEDSLETARPDTDWLPIGELTTW